MLQRTLPAGFIAPCLPTKTDRLPSGSGWLHEIKHGHCPQEGHAGEALQPSHALVCSATAKFIKRATPREASAYRDLTSRPRSFYLRSDPDRGAQVFGGWARASARHVLARGWR